MSVSDTPRRATIRKAFEDWIKASGEHPMKSCGAVYLDDSHRDKWEAWEAAVDAVGAIEWEAFELTAANNAIAEMEAEHAWISVSERLPEFGSRVLIFWQGKYDSFIGSGNYTSLVNSTPRADVGEGRMCPFLHWMPLPEGPE
jgi:hypothetical protein